MWNWVGGCSFNTLGLWELKKLLKKIFNTQNLFQLKVLGNPVAKSSVGSTQGQQ